MTTKTTNWPWERKVLIGIVALILNALATRFIIQASYGDAAWDTLRHMPGYNISDLSSFVLGGFLFWVASHD